jgi:hypothetical protein
MPLFRIILIVSIAPLLIMATHQPVMTARNIPEVFEYSFDDVDSIKIYAGPVVFSHAKHVTDYGLSCNACHHTLEDEEIKVEEHCSDCHSEAGFVRGKEAEQLSEDELIEHYLNALHLQCIGCHKREKIEDRQRNLPVGCTQCHDRKKLPMPE